MPCVDSGVDALKLCQCRRCAENNSCNCSRRALAQFRFRVWRLALPLPAGVPDGMESDKGEFMNHCCEPNAVFLNDDYMIAIKPIEVDDEVTYDYACSETPTSSHMPFNCACGKAGCRGQITGYDLLKKDVRMKYGSFMFTSNAVRYQKKYEAGELVVPEGILKQ